MSRELFEQVCARSGLAAMVGPGAVQRALASVGATIDDARPDDYRRALPQLRARMAIYLAPADVDRNLQAIEELLAG